MARADSERQGHGLAEDTDPLFQLAVVKQCSNAIQVIPMKTTAGLDDSHETGAERCLADAALIDRLPGIWR